MMMSIGPSLPSRSLRSTSLLVAVSTSPAQTSSKYSMSVPPLRTRLKGESVRK